eukprot:jgi/Chlat1/3306/Chrsp22S03468
MPLYELLVIAKAALDKGQVASILRRAGSTALTNGGVVTGVRSYGLQQLAYTLRRPGEQHEAGHIVEMRFNTRPEVLREIEFGLRTDERLLRFLVVKKPSLMRLKPERPDYLPHDESGSGWMEADGGERVVVVGEVGEEGEPASSPASL